jgi:hypothetical protein
MLSRQFSESLQAVVKRLAQLSLDDSELRTSLQRLCEDYLDATDQFEDSGDEHARDDHARDTDPRGGSSRDRYEEADERQGSNYDSDNYRRSARQERPVYGEQRPSYNAPNRYDAAPRYEARGGNYDRSSYDRGNDLRGGDPRGGFDRGNSYDRGSDRGGFDQRGGRGFENRPQRSDNEELQLIEDRCRLKAKGARWAAERRRMINSGSDFRVEIDPKDREIITLAKSIPDCFLWMNHPSGPSPANLNLFDDLAACFETLGDSVAALRNMLPDAEAFPEVFNRAMDLAAEAQSMLRNAVYRIDGPNDNDQNAVFHWLKRTAAAMQVFIQRYMRADDTANPTKASELSDRIRQCEKELGKAKIKDRERSKHLAKIRPLVRDLETTNDKADQWLQIADAVDEAVNSGLPVTDQELRNLISPLLRSIPKNSKYPEGFQTVLTEYEHSAMPAPVASGSAIAEDEDDLDDDDDR